MSKKKFYSRNARKAADRHDRKLVSETQLLRLIKEARKELRDQGKRDLCRDVAKLLNRTRVDGKKILRGRYRNGELNFNRWSVRDIWYRQTGRDWSDWKASTHTNKAQKQSSKRVPRSKKRRLGWWHTPGYISKTAHNFGASTKDWTPAPAEEIIAHLQTSTIRTLDQAATALNAEGMLRPNYRNGAPKWTGSASLFSANR